jgi:hypothetical protein
MVIKPYRTFIFGFPPAYDDTKELGFFAAKLETKGFLGLGLRP